MPIGLLKDIINTMPRGLRLLGLDVGTKTIGLALADPGLTVVTPLKTIKRTKFTRDATEIGQVVQEYEVGGLIIGLPLNMDGSEGRACQSVRDFTAELARVPGIPGWLALFDERLSTAAGESFVDKHVDINKRQAKDRGIIDQLAAAHILEAAVDYIKL